MQLWIRTVRAKAAYAFQYRIKYTRQFQRLVQKITAFPKITRFVSWCILASVVWCIVAFFATLHPHTLSSVKVFEGRYIPPSIFKPSISLTPRSDREPVRSCNSSLVSYTPIVDVDDVDFEKTTMPNYLINGQWKLVSPFCNLQDIDGMLHFYCYYASLQVPMAPWAMTKQETLEGKRVLCYVSENLTFWSEPITITAWHGYIRCNIPSACADDVVSYLDKQQQSLSILTEKQVQNRQLARLISERLRIPVCVGSIAHHSRPKYELSAALVVHPSGDPNDQSELRLREFVAYHLYQGFDHVYVFDHVFDRMHQPERVRYRLFHAVQDFIDDGSVTYIQWPLPHFFGNSEQPWHGAPWIFQFSAFAFVFNEFRKETKAIWISDFDLYLIPTARNKNVKQILSPLLFSDDNISHSYAYEMDVKIAYPDVTHTPSNIGCAPRFDTFLQRYTCYDPRFDRSLPKILATTNNAVSGSIHFVLEWKKGTVLKKFKDNAVPIFALHATDNVAKHLEYGQIVDNELDQFTWLAILKTLQCDMELHRIMTENSADFQQSDIYRKYLAATSEGNIKGVVDDSGVYCWKVH